ncbi:hypothetical protein BJ508DRAFT_336835 [Ascobolus immersus RN42]|uniref:Uncharacterized protein n=1 Tax=Ascobolus immersus RN42 TaxID=1160509 RepID=A0A3N4H753_ASCIM|nr:hypothetical protein BJ508DRAFT_336835 [Ascobolus immersus RN42]
MHEKEPHKVAQYVKSLTDNLRYTTLISALHATKIKLRYISIVEPLLAPFAVHMTFTGSGASSNLDSDLKTIGSAYISLLCTEAHNVLKQWASGSPNPKGGLGNAVSQADIYFQHKTTIAAMKPSRMDSLFQLLVANINRRLDARGDIITQTQTAHEDSASDAEQEEFIKASFKRLDVIRKATNLRRSSTPALSVEPVEPTTKVGVSKKMKSSKPKTKSSLEDNKEPDSSTLASYGFEVVLVIDVTAGRLGLEVDYGNGTRNFDQAIEAID